MLRKQAIKIILVPLTLNILHSQDIYAPQNLQLTESSLVNIGLTWETPEAFRIQSITHFNGFIFNGVGNSNNSPAVYLQRFSNEMLSDDQNHGKIIKSISFYSFNQSSFQPLVFMTSGLGSDTIPDISSLTNCVLSSPKLINPPTSSWVTAELYNYISDLNDTTEVSSITIDSTMDIWFGVIISDYTAPNYPMGVDNGPDVNGYGNMMSSLGININFNSGYFPFNWQTLSDNNPDLPFNWALKLNLIQDKSLDEYLIYEDSILIANKAPECDGSDNCLSEFIDLGPRIIGSHSYYATSLHHDGESNASNIVDVDVYNSPPGGFNLVEPNDGDSYQFSDNQLNETIRFIWRDANDIDEQVLNYNLEICNGSFEEDCWDTTLVQNDELLAGSFCLIEIPVQNLIDKLTIEINQNEILWTVNAYDGFDSTEVDGGFGTFYLNFDFLKTTYKEILPNKFISHQNYPNPFNPITNLKYDLPENSYVSITIYDMLGNVVNDLINKNQNFGSKSVQWNSTNNQGEPVSAGVYLYKIQAGDFSQTKKMILLK